MIELYNGDCLEIMPEIEDKSINLIVIDPPYNIGKDKTWDKWKKQSDYVEWLGSIFLECQRVLKDNGSFYFFHNDFLQIVELQNWINKNTKFVFKQLITWTKISEEFKNSGFVQQRLSIDMMRNYYGGFTEYCLYYTFQDETGLTTVYSDRNNFTPIRDYMLSELDKTGKTKKEINEILGSSTTGGGMACHIFGNTDQWTLPTEDKYKKLQRTGYFQRGYPELRKEYESLRKEYESLRYTFNNEVVKQDLRANSNTWQYPPAEQNGHITPKPVPLIENIIKHSSNENDLVLDCFMGSGTTGVACKNLNRNFIGIEKEERYFKIAQNRIENVEMKLAI